jgi:Mycoplasma protein of unknown function, DUF285
MTSMLSDIREFNQPVTSWDTGLVNRMDNMFWRSTKFNQSLVRALSSRPVGSLRTSVRLDMTLSLTCFVQSLLGGLQANFVTSRVTNFNGMFFEAPSFSGIGLEYWNTSLVTSANSMFMRVRESAHECDFNGRPRLHLLIRPCAACYTSQALSFNANISGWDVSRVIDTVRTDAPFFVLGDCPICDLHCRTCSELCSWARLCSIKTLGTWSQRWAANRTSPGQRRTFPHRTEPK